MEKSNHSLKGKVVIITRGRGVHCEVLAYALARKGAKVAILDLNLGNAIEEAAEIQNKTRWVNFCKKQRSSKTSLIEANQIVLDKFGLCDILVEGTLGNHPIVPQVINYTPLGRFGQREVLSSSLLRLVTEQYSFVIGIVVPIDKVFSAYSGP